MFFTYHNLVDKEHHNKNNTEVHITLFKMIHYEEEYIQGQQRRVAHKTSPRYTGISYCPLLRLQHL